MTERTLTILADGEALTGSRRVFLEGRDAAGLLPQPFTLTLWNLPDAAYDRLSGARRISAEREGTVLAAGAVSDFCRRRVPEGTVTEVLFSAALPLWEAPVSLSVPADTSVSETLRLLLAASGTGIPLLPSPFPDPVRARPQAFCGRAAECLEEAAGAAGARLFLSPAGLSVLPSSGVPVTLTLSGEALREPPLRTGSGLLLVRTLPVGWPLGQMIRAEWGDNRSARGLAVERAVCADNTQGPWQAELLLEVIP